MYANLTYFNLLYKSYETATNLVAVFHLYEGENNMWKKVVWIILVLVCGMVLGMLSPTK